MTLEASLDDYNEDDTKARLALLYNVSVDAISLKVAAGSLKLSITIQPVDRSEGGVAALIQNLESKSVDELSTALGSNATVTAVVEEEVEEEYEATCPKGFWCSVGLDIPCGESTYNDQLDQNNQGACKPCPKDAVSSEGATSIEACVCKPGYYDEAAAPGVVLCVQCKTGSNCSDSVQGVTLALLPLLPGYYRTTNASADLRRCPDFGVTSGCVGGVGDGEGPCREWLRGPYCKLCEVTDGSMYYDVGASACVVCEGDAVAPIMLGCGVFFAAAIGALLWVRFMPHRNVRCLARLVRRAAQLSAQLSLRPKGKQLLGFYQIATRVSEVYDVPMPAAVARMLAVFEVLAILTHVLTYLLTHLLTHLPTYLLTYSLTIFEVLNVNIGGVGLPLQCLGLGTYGQQLQP